MSQLFPISNESISLSILSVIGTSCASFAIQQILDTTTAKPLRKLVADLQGKTRQRIRNFTGIEPVAPSTNHDIQRSLAFAFVRAAERWVHTVKKEARRPDLSCEKSDLVQFCERVDGYLRDLTAAARNRHHDFAQSAPDPIIQKLIDLVPEALVDPDDLAETTKMLTATFESFIKKWEAQSLPDFARQRLFQKSDEGQPHFLFGYDVFRAFLDILKSPDYPEATIAFELRIFGEIRKELSGFADQISSLGLVASEVELSLRHLEIMQGDIGQIGQVAYDLQRDLHNQGKLLKITSIDIAAIRRDIDIGSKARNHIPLDRKIATSGLELNSFVAMRFEQRGTAFVGRDTELAQLNAFLDDERPLLWWQIAGAAGQGKSRLGLHLLDQLGSDWHAGFLERERLYQNWGTISFRDRTLVIIDYIAAPGKAALFVNSIKALQLRLTDPNTGLPVGAKLRFLILEREGYDAKDNFGRSAASWYSLIKQSDEPAMIATRYGERPLLLDELSRPDMIAIANSWRTRAQGTPNDRLSEQQADKLVALMGGAPDDAEDLARSRPRAWRPLFAMMIGEHLDRFEQHAADDEGIYDILAKAFEAEQQEYWTDQYKTAVFPSTAAQNLACLATMIGVYDHANHHSVLESTEPADYPADNFYGPFEEDDIFREASMALGYNIDPIMPDGSVFPLIGRQPDLLGEFLVLWCLGRSRRGGIRKAEKRAERLVKDGRSLAPSQLDEFVLRLNQDFPKKDISRMVTSVYQKSISTAVIMRKTGISARSEILVFE